MSRYTHDTKDTRSEMILQLGETLPLKTLAYLQQLQRELFYTWCFLAQEGYLDEAREFVGEHMEEATPLEPDLRYQQL